MTARAASIRTAAALLVALEVGAPSLAHAGADNCLAAPNAGALQGNHWYYRLDRLKQRKCWYLRPQTATAPKVSAPENPEAYTEAADAGQKSMMAAKHAALQPAIELLSVQPDALSNKATPQRARDGVGADMSPDADAAPPRVYPSAVVADAVSFASPSSSAGFATAPQTRKGPATGMTLHQEARNPDELGKQAAETAHFPASRNMMPLPILLSGALLLISGIFLHTIVGMFARLRFRFSRDHHTLV